MNNLFLKNKYYYIFNMIVLLVASYFYYKLYVYIDTVILNYTINYIPIVVTALLIICILALKYIRSISILMCLQIKNEALLKAFLKTSFVSAIYPFKSGDIFRMYAYCYELKSYRFGIIAILIDRYYDIFGLLIVLLSITLVSQQIYTIYPVIIFITILFIMLTLIFLSFDKTQYFFSQYIICNIHSKLGLSILKIIHNMRTIYNDISILTSNRGFLLVIISIISWAVEFTALYTITSSVQNLRYTYTDYINMLFYVQDLPVLLYLTVYFAVVLTFNILVYSYYWLRSSK